MGKETPSDTTKFIYDGDRLLEETDGSDDLQRGYTSTLEQWGELLSEYDGSDTAYHLSDALGSTDALLDDDESATDRYQYRAFGLKTHQGSNESPFTFVGGQNYYRDSDLELYYASARYYDPAPGRWLSQDPIGFEAGDSNLYRYVHNNPVNETDPSGLEDWSRQSTTRCHEPQSAGDGHHLSSLSLLSDSRLSPEEEKLRSMLSELRQRGNRLLKDGRIDDSLIQSMRADGQLRFVDSGKAWAFIHAVMPLPDGKQLVLQRCFTTPWLLGQEGEVYWTVYDVYPASTAISFELIANHKAIGHGLRRAQDMITAIHSIPFGVAVDYAYSGEGNLLDATLLTIGDCFMVSGMAMHAAGETGRVATVLALGDTAFEGGVATKRLFDAYEFAAQGRDFEARLASAEALIRLVGVSFSASDLLGTARQAYANRLARRSGVAVAPTSVTGETASTAKGKTVHKAVADARRASGEFDLVQMAIKDKAGNPILVSKRVNLKTGLPQPGAKLQEAIPDAVSFRRKLIVDDKPLGRPIAKDRQEMIRFIEAYRQREGHLPDVIAIQRYDPETGRPILTELYSPSDFLP